MSKYDIRVWVFLLTAGVLLTAIGCAGSSINNTVGQTYIAIEAAANTAKLECGNTVPGGPCLPTSAISTKQKDEIKDSLQIAKSFADDMAAIAAGGEGVNCSTTTQCLQAVNHVLGTVEAILVARGAE